MISISDMRYELRQYAQIPDSTPDETVMALYHIYELAINQELTQETKDALEKIFGLTEQGNIEAMDKLRDLQHLQNKGSMAWWDEMGIPADEMSDNG